MYIVYCLTAVYIIITFLHTSEPLQMGIIEKAHDMVSECKHYTVDVARSKNNQLASMLYARRSCR